MINHRFSGYFARVRAYQILVEEFLALTNRECQIVNLGAGFDTLYWLLYEKSTQPKLFMEVDFGNITAKKCRYIRFVLLPHTLMCAQVCKLCFHSLHRLLYHLVLSHFNKPCTQGLIIIISFMKGLCTRLEVNVHLIFISIYNIQ